MNNYVLCVAILCVALTTDAAEPVQQIGGAVKQAELKLVDPFKVNLLKNPSFERQIIDWRIRPGILWTPDGGVQNSGALAIHAERPKDDRYIHEVIAEQCVRLTSAERYRLSARIKLDGMPTNTVANRANMIWFESSDCSTGGQWGGYIEAKGIEGWQTVIGDKIMPALDAKAALVTLVQNGRTSNGGTAYWDDIYLKAIE